MLQTWRDGVSKHAFCRGCFRWQSSRDLSSRSHDIRLAPARGIAAHHANSLLRRRRLPAASICQGGAAASLSCSHLGSSARHKQRVACTNRATSYDRTKMYVAVPMRHWGAGVECKPGMPAADAVHSNFRNAFHDVSTPDAASPPCSWKSSASAAA